MFDKGLVSLSVTLFPGRAIFFLPRTETKKNSPRRGGDLGLPVVSPVAARDVLRGRPRRLGVVHAFDGSSLVQERSDAVRRQRGVVGRQRVGAGSREGQDRLDREALRGSEQVVGGAVVGGVERSGGVDGVGLFFFIFFVFSSRRVRFFSR